MNNNVYDKVNLKGSVSYLQNLTNRQLTNLTRKELAKVVSKLASASNKRIKRLIQSGVPSPALIGLIERGKVHFGVKGKNIDQLKKEYLEVKSYLSSETSTVKGARKVMNTVIDTLKNKKGIEITENQYKDFFKIYERVKEVDPYISSQQMKYKVFESISNKMDYANPDDVIDSVIDDLENLYEQSVKESEEYDLSRFFEID